MSDIAFQQDRKLVPVLKVGSVWQVRRKRRQLMRRWAKRYSLLKWEYGRWSWLSYCEYVNRDGYYGAPWVKQEGV